MTRRIVDRGVRKGPDATGRAIVRPFHHNAVDTRCLSVTTASCDVIDSVDEHCKLGVG